MALLTVLLGCGFHASAPGKSRDDAGLRDATTDGTGVDAATDAAVDAAIDAPPDAARACSTTACLGIGGTCQQGVCVVEVLLAGPLTCPAGLSCRFDCNSGVACKGGIDCSQADHCTIDCAQMNSCQGSTFSCQGGCTLYCRQANTCTNIVLTCGAGGDGCTRECCPGSSCGGNIQSTGSSVENSPGTCP